MIDVVHPLIIVGAGPIGLEAALYAAEAGIEFLLLEKDQPVAALQSWGKVAMFSPVAMNITPLGVRATGIAPSDRCLTGHEMKTNYYDKIARQERIAPYVITGFTVERISRRGLVKAGLLGNPERADHPFMIMGTNRQGIEQRYLARHVIDASGVYTNPNWLGSGGLPALGERKLRDKVFYDLSQLPDEGTRARRFLVVGAGHSAATVLRYIDRLTHLRDDVSATWVTHTDAATIMPEVRDDPLPERGRMNAFINELARGANKKISRIGGYWVDRMVDNGGALTVTLTNHAGESREVTADQIYALVGYRPDRTIYEELQVHECYASAGPMKLSAALLASNAGGDCTASIDASDQVYTNPEPNFYILGAKSYGRTSNFLIAKGHDQITAVFKMITGDKSLDLYQQAKPGPATTPQQKPRQVAKVSLDSLDNLWFQVGGTICNLSCDHCFISCSPQNDKFKMMTLEQIRPFLHEAVTMGVKEFYFTGGEPFLNDEIFDILRETLAIGPATVLTNGTIITERRARELAALEEASNYTLELRVSLDGFTDESNDRLRGKGSFRRAIKGIQRLVDLGMLPIITAVQTWPETEHETVLGGFKQLLADIGYTRPRFKIIPALDLGAYNKNSIGEATTEYVTEEMMHGFDSSQLICSNSRMVTNSGVYVCPILIDYPDARMGETIAATEGDYRLRHPACYTCYISGAICSNFASGGRSER